MQALDFEAPSVAVAEPSDSEEPSAEIVGALDFAEPSVAIAESLNSENSFVGSWNSEVPFADFAVA